MTQAKSKRNDKSAAILTIFDIGKMDLAGRKMIARWLRDKANMVVKEGAARLDNGKSAFASRFTCRYIYEDKPNGRRKPIKRPVRARRKN